MTRLVRMAAVAVALVALAACTRSMDYDYKPNAYAPDGTRAVKVGVLELDDKRSWVEPGNEKSKSFFMSAGAWRFGLSHGDKDYAPIGEIVQDILVDELKDDGFMASAVAGKSSAAASVARSAGMNYVIGGDVQAFEVGMDPGFVTITTRKQVNINLSVYNAQGQLVDGPTNFAHSYNSNEGMAVMHSTNIDQLFNETLKPVMKRVVERLQSRLAQRDVQVNLVLNGKVYPLDMAMLGR